jgi:hypothetical protein
VLSEGGEGGLSGDSSRRSGGTAPHSKSTPRRHRRRRLAMPKSPPFTNLLVRNHLRLGVRSFSIPTSAWAVRPRSTPHLEVHVGGEESRCRLERGEVVHVHEAVGPFGRPPHHAPDPGQERPPCRLVLQQVRAVGPAEPSTKNTTESHKGGPPVIRARVHGTLNDRTIVRSG